MKIETKHTPRSTSLPSRIERMETQERRKRLSAVAQNTQLAGARLLEERDALLAALGLYRTIKYLVEDGEQ